MLEQALRRMILRPMLGVFYYRFNCFGGLWQHITWLVNRPLMGEWRNRSFISSSRMRDYVTIKEIISASNARVILAIREATNAYLVSLCEDCNFFMIVIMYEFRKF